MQEIINKIKKQIREEFPNQPIYLCLSLGGDLSLDIRRVKPSDKDIIAEALRKYNLPIR